MTLGTMSPEARTEFDRICKAVTAPGHGIGMDQLSDSGALARELDREEPEPERVEALAARLGVDVDEIGTPA